MVLIVIENKYTKIFVELLFYFLLFYRIITVFEA